ncbi:Zn(2)-C6 fungal-type domain-containing protein [Fusarium sp. LHS14.1]|nr:Zn(2)-C6 fungal-type domain-containing protein [Fusarium sp. LHS14.1]
MDQYDTQLNTTPPSQPQSNTRAVAGSRRYRSKSQRPCDLCRARKVLCNIPEPGQPCQLCERTSRLCTFVGNPGKKQRDRASRAQSGGTPPVAPPTRESVAFTDTIHVSEQPVDESRHQEMLGITGGHVQADQVGGEDLPRLDTIISDAMWSNHGGMDWDLSMNHTALPSIERGDRAFQFLGDGQLPDLGPLEGESPLDDLQNAEAMNRMSTETPASPNMPLERLSLDQRPDHFTQIIGYSNESDPFGLEHFPYNDQEEVDFFRVTYRRFSARSGEVPGYPPLHFLQSQTETAIEARRVIEECMSTNDDRENLEKLVDKTAGVALVKLYFRFIFESLPILSRSLVLQDIEAFVAEAPTGLLAGIYALASPFTAWDEKLCLSSAYSKPSIDALWKISYTCLQRELHFPRLSTIQIFILLINHMPFDTAVVESPFFWSLAASMLAMAESLGLNVDPTGWNLPPWEIRLRRRLWWTVVVEHTWRSITHGRSSMLHDDDWDVSPPTPDDFVIDANIGPLDDTGHQDPDYFIHMCSLTGISMSICRRFFSLRAVSRPQTLDTLIEQARAPRQKLLDWLENLPESLHIQPTADDAEADDSVRSHASLYVAYYTTHILVLRALLRPIINSSIHLDHLQPSVGTVLQASRGLVQTIIKFIRSLDATHQSAFWPSYTRHCLSYPGLFCYMLCSQQREPHMASFDQNLLATWRRTLRMRVQSWPLLRFGTVKVDALYWKKLR